METKLAARERPKDDPTPPEKEPPAVHQDVEGVQGDHVTVDTVNAAGVVNQNTTFMSPVQATPSSADCEDLIDASRRGNLEEVKRILSRGVDVNCSLWAKWDRTPVMAAAEGGHRDVVELLVSRGADVSLVNEYGNNILHWACVGGHVEMVEFVLSLNVVPDINARSKWGDTAADLARLQGHTRVVNLLVSRGAQ